MQNEKRLAEQLQFVLEIDRLKHIVRQTILLNGSRKENDAEHCWHVALMAFLLREYAADPDVDVFHVVRMLLVHDLVEIDAGDTYCYDEAARCDQADRERLAADRIFNLLPPDQAAEFRRLWDEFEARETREARYAAALDRFQPLLINYHRRGESWMEHGVTAEQVIRRNSPIHHGAPRLWQHAESLIADAVKRGWLTENHEEGGKAEA